MNQIRDIFRLARPHHWVKNVLVLLPVVFAQRMGDPSAWIAAAVAAASFCLAGSAVYLFNDIHDRHADRLHPRKRLRPIAAGQVSVATAALLSAALALAALAVAWAAATPVTAIVGAYLLLQAAYSTHLKHKMLLDVIVIALGFVLRAVGGAAAIAEQPSHWLIICTFTLCLFLGFCKRWSELRLLGGSETAGEHRQTLADYTSDLLMHLITLSAGIAVMSYLLYATSDVTVSRFRTIYLVYTLPLVIYGVFRFAMLTMKGRYSDPTELILHDRPFQWTLVLWLACVAAIIKWGYPLQQWLQGLN